MYKAIKLTWSWSSLQADSTLPARMWSTGRAELLHQCWLGGSPRTGATK